MLPKIDVPIYTIKLLSNKKELRFRPFSVKEEKLFLMANESEELDAVVDTIKQILNNCILDDFDIDSLPMFDLEYLFLNIRARSISELIDLKYKCNNKVTNEDGEEKTCGNIVEIQLNVLEIQPEKNESHSNKIEITDKVGMVMRYPNFNTMKKYQGKNEAEVILKLTADCIDYIYDGEQFYYASEAQPGEFLQWVEGLNQKQFNKIEEFFNNLPELKETIEVTCSKCGYQHKITVQGLENFFG